jgi:hypothetical protein
MNTNTESRDEIRKLKMQIAKLKEENEILKARLKNICYSVAKICGKAEG